MYLNNKNVLSFDEPVLCEYRTWSMLNAWQPYIIRLHDLKYKQYYNIYVRRVGV